MDKRRQLYLHVGAPKTGSSALQAYFFQNRHLLEAEGLAYELADEVEGQDGQFLNIMGNGLSLREAALSMVSPDQMKNCIKQYFGKYRKCLISTELFYDVPVESFKLIKKCCIDLGVDVIVIVFVRNISSLVLSSYHQVIKNHTYSSDLISYIDTLKESPHVSYLKRLGSVFSNEEMHVLHYETDQNSLDRAILKILGIDASKFDRSALQAVVNRSLHQFEVDLLLKANSLISRIGDRDVEQRLSTALSVHLRSQFPDLPSVKSMSAEERSVIAEKFQSDADWLNKTYFGDAMVVSVLGNEALVSVHIEPLSDSDKLEIMEAAFLWAVSRLSVAYQRQSVSAVVDYAVRAEKKAKSCPLPEEGIPEDFDPFYYLMRYPDLVRAEVDPFKHFLSSGRDEGRRYNWRND